MIQKHRPKRASGQGLVEFALVLPLLLLLLVGLAEFARAFAIYTNLFNAAREGTRYGMVNANDTSGILSATQAKIAFVDPAEVSTTIRYDSGPGTVDKVPPSLLVGDRVIVSVHYDIEPLLPLLGPLMDNLSVDTEAARSITKVGAGAIPPAGAPTPTPDLDATATATAATATAEAEATATATAATATAEAEATATATAATATAEAAATATASAATATAQAKASATASALATAVSAAATAAAQPEPDPIQIAEPLIAGSRTVSGWAEPNASLTLKDETAAKVLGSTYVNALGYFVFNLEYSGLELDHVMKVVGYGTFDVATVQAGAPAPPTLEPTLTPTLTPTPGATDIQIDPLCGPVGRSATITVLGIDWPEANVKIKHIFDGELVQEWTLLKGDFDFNFQVPISIDNPQLGEHTIQALYYSPSDDLYVLGDSEPFTVPCTTPNLIVERIVLENDDPILIDVPVTLSVSVANLGGNTVNALFWADLFINPTSPISPTNPPFETSADWAAINSLGGMESITVTLDLPSGIQESGVYTAFVMVDTMLEVVEGDELDNVAGPVTFTVFEGEPTPTPVPGQPGAISGSTWLFVDPGYVSQEGVTVSCYDGEQLVAETLSGPDGSYLLQDLPPGTYTVIGEFVMGEQPYSGVVLDVPVQSEQTTLDVTVHLH